MIAVFEEIDANGVVTAVGHEIHDGDYESSSHSQNNDSVMYHHDNKELESEKTESIYYKRQ